MESHSKFGNIKVNAAAVGARHTLKFFDSADWAVGDNRDGESLQLASEDIVKQMLDAIISDVHSPLAVTEVSIE